MKWMTMRCPGVVRAELAEEDNWPPEGGQLRIGFRV